MSYVPAIALVVIGLALLAAMAIRVLRVVRRFNQTMSLVATNTQERTGLLRARSAALRVALTHRRGRSETPVTSHLDADRRPPC